MNKSSLGMEVPLDLTSELSDIKRRLESLEIKILTAWREPRLDPQRISVDHEGVIEKTKEGAKPYV